MLIISKSKPLKKCYNLSTFFYKLSYFLQIDPFFYKNGICRKFSRSCKVGYFAIIQRSNNFVEIVDRVERKNCPLI